MKAGVDVYLAVHKMQECHGVDDVAAHVDTVVSTTHPTRVGAYLSDVPR